MQNDHESTIIEVYLRKDRSISIEMITEVIPQVVQIGVGNIEDLYIDHTFLDGLISTTPNVSGIVIPESIPSPLIAILSPLMICCNNIYYVKNGETGLEVNAYSMKTGYLPEDIMKHRMALDEVPDGFHEMPEKKEDIDDGFHPIEYPETIDPGFHPIENSLDDVVDGFHDVPVEKREMWTEDVDRMNRLSYLPIANILSVDTFPEELGGGSIR